MDFLFPIIVANWKMYFTYNQARTWCQEHQQHFSELTKKNTLVLCPSYESLASLASLLNHSPVALGAQNCSGHTNGAYTGQIMAKSLQELNVQYCIIGHSEVRTYLSETNDQLKQKVEQLFLHNIMPIFCVGESKHEYENNMAFEKIHDQLQPLMTALEQEHHSKALFIAYEPIWSIGTGVVADNTHIHTIITYIHKLLDPYKKSHKIHTLYGGTVNGETILELKKIDLLHGFLVGKASTNFQELKKIVSLIVK